MAGDTPHPTAIVALDPRVFTDLVVLAACDAGIEAERWTPYHRRSIRSYDVALVAGGRTPLLPPRVRAAFVVELPELDRLPGRVTVRRESLAIRVPVADLEGLVRLVARLGSRSARLRIAGRVR